MQKITHEEIIKRAEYIGQVAEAELFEADRRGGYSTQLKDAIHETQFPFTALPLQIFSWVSQPKEAFQEKAAAAIVISWSRTSAREPAAPRNNP